MIRTKKITAGLYTFDYAGRTFQIENIATATDGDAAPGWMAYEMVIDAAGTERREYMNDFGTKRAAIDKTVAAVDAGY